MNKLIIIGNVVHTPEVKTTPQGISLTKFTVAVNMQTRTDYFHVATWRKLADTCAQYLDKGRKVAVVGDVTARAYSSHTGEAKCSLEVTADSVEFISPRAEGAAQGPRQATDDFVDITDDDLPFV